jgi:hypothetical protein
MHVANTTEGNWTTRTNLDATGRTVASLEKVWRRKDVHLIRVEGHSVHEYPGNGIADELAWWKKVGPPLCRLRPRGGEGASWNMPVANYEACVWWRVEEKVAAARANGERTEMLRWPHDRTLRWGALWMRWKGLLAERPSERTLRLTWWAWRETLPKVMFVMV